MEKKLEILTMEIIALEDKVAAKDTLLKGIQEMLQNEEDNSNISISNSSILTSIKNHFNESK